MATVCFFFFEFFGYSPTFFPLICFAIKGRMYCMDSGGVALAFCMAFHILSIRESIFPQDDSGFDGRFTGIVGR